MRSRLDLPGALGRVGLPSLPGKRGGGSIWFGGGPLLATTDKCSFFHASKRVFASTELQPAVLSPHSVSLCQFLILNLFIHSTFFGGVQRSQKIIAQWHGECRGRPAVVRVH